jgi:hypothetical protein
MPISKDRPFKSPRQAKVTVVTKDSDEDDRPIVQTLATTKRHMFIGKTTVSGGNEWRSS